MNEERINGELVGIVRNRDLSLEEKVESLERFCGRSKPRARTALQFLVLELETQNARLQSVQAKQEQLREIIHKVTAAPLHRAVFVGAVNTPSLGVLAEVAYKGDRRIVQVADGLQVEQLEPGQSVCLGSELNVVVGTAPESTRRFGEIAIVERRLAEDTLILRDRDTELVVQVGGALREHSLEPGDTVRWSRDLMMAFEVLEGTGGDAFFFEEVSGTTPQQIAGCDDDRDRVIASFTLNVARPDIATRYGLGQRKSLLMVGPPGCGKTLRMRVVASKLSRLTGKTCRVAVVNGAELESPWVGEAQQNIKRLFRSLREQTGPKILFLDEVEAIGRIRGSAAGQHSDRFLSTWLTELDGLREHNDVAVIAATNRKDLVDQALLERISGMEVHVGRPRLDAARAIFGVHLQDTLPFRPNGHEAGETRRGLIDLAVTRLYGPNADNRLATLKFRDGTQRHVQTREMVSGRLIKQICEAARESAFQREVQDGIGGVGREDMEQALSNAVEKLRCVLTARNAADHLLDLPEDVEVVAVEKPRRVVQSHNYIVSPGPVAFAEHG